jgi:hypothetical protein
MRRAAMGVKTNGGVALDAGFARLAIGPPRLY